MKNIKDITCIAIVLGAVTVFCASFGLAQTDKPKTEDWTAAAERAARDKMWGLIHYYKPTEDQKVKLKKALIAQYKDLMDHDKIHAPKIKALDDEIEVVRKKISELRKEIDAIEKRKAVHTTVRSELILDHKAEIANVFTLEQRIARLSHYILNSAVGHQYLAVLPEETRDPLIKKCDAVALDLIETGKEGDKDAFHGVCRKIRSDSKGLITPEIRKAGETKYMLGSVLRRFGRVKLTEPQKETVRDMCEKVAKRRGELHAQYEQASKDRSALRDAMNKISSGRRLHQIYEEVIEDVLTDAQVKQGRFKRKSQKTKSPK
jgi:hypothetical protein